MTKMSPLRTMARVLFFRASREELLDLDRRHLALGLLATWLVGIGRYWDSPRARLYQRLSSEKFVPVTSSSAAMTFLYSDSGMASARKVS